MRGILISALFGAAFAGCLSAPAVPTGGSGGSNETPSGSGGSNGVGSGGSGSTASGGATGSGGVTASGGATGSGGVMASGGATGSGGVTESGGATGSGAVKGSGGGTASGGATATGGSNGEAGRGAGTGGVAASGGMPGKGGSTGSGGGVANGGAGGGSSSTPGFAMPLRLEDACGAVQSSTTCLHQGKTSDDGLPFNNMASVTMGGTPGTMYQVKIRVRGIVEPTTITGGTVGTPRQFVTGGTAKPDMGNSGDGAYNQWRLTTTVPSQTYYLNAYSNTGHTIYGVDYMQTITIGGGSSVKLDVHDSNAHLITNTKDAMGPVMPSGLPPLMNNNVGQVVQIDTVQ